MSLRLLFGPVSREWAREHIAVGPAVADIRNFAPTAPADFVIGIEDPREFLAIGSASDWQPDAIVLYFHDQYVPPAIWSASIPVLALIPDVRSCWHAFRRLVPYCDLVFVDPTALPMLQRAGFENVRGLDFSVPREALTGCISSLSAEWPLLQRHFDARRSLRSLDVTTRAWLQLTCPRQPDPSLRRVLRFALEEQPRSASLYNLLGAIVLETCTADQMPAARIEAANAFQEAWRADPRHIVAGLNLAEVLVLLGLAKQADEQARRTVAMLDELDFFDADLLDAPVCPQGDMVFRPEWERVAWMYMDQRNAEVQAKCTLLRWRLHRLLAQLHDDETHTFLANALRPDWHASKAALGFTLYRKGRMRDAIPILREAVSANPYDADSARLLNDALGRLGMTRQQQRLATERRSLSGQDMARVAREPWFFDQPMATLVSKSTPLLPSKICWKGSQESINSLAGVNREICQRLVGRSHEVSVLPARHPDPPGERVPLASSLQQAQGRSISPAEFHIGHEWPPDFTPPVHGHWIIMQPWEFGSLPRGWLEPMATTVDEIWVPTQFVREGFLRSGLVPDQVHVVPLAAADAFFRECKMAYPLRTTKRFKFLFVGGTIPRKGIDLLLKAYTQTFSSKDDVCLVIKDMGFGTFYQGQTAEQLITQARRMPHGPEIEYLHGELSEDEMRGLYAACDCLVHPYRGEGFGLPITEAMACGLPVLVTGYGACLDYCRDEHAYLIPARVVHFPEKRVGDLETVDLPWWAEPDIDAMRYLLRHVATNPDQAKAKGVLGQEFLRAHFTWDHTIRIIEERLAARRGQPIRRKTMRYQSASVPSPMPAAKCGRVSLTMIVKNEEANLPACLASVADLVHEIIIVDTGSTDRTKEIALQHGAKVFDFPWIDSFSAARNESLRHATGEWIFWMDADDRLDELNRKKLREIFTNLPNENVGFVMKCLCLPDIETGTSTIVDHIRLFRSHPQVRWTYRIHEQILPAIRRQGGKVQWSDVVVHHVGYRDSNVRKGKLQRDLRLLTMEYEEQPEDPFTLFNLASVYSEQGKTSDALDLFRRSLKRSAPEDSIVRKLYAQIIQCHRHLGQSREALHACQDAIKHYPDDHEILFQEALTLRDLGDRQGAIATLERLLTQRDGRHFASLDVGLRGYKTRHNLAVFLREEGRLDDAEKQWSLALEEQPDFGPALFGIAEICLAREDWPGFDKALQRIDQSAKNPLEAQILRARKHLALREFSLARDAIEIAIRMNGKAVWPRVVLTHILLQEAKDWVAAEKALRDVLALDPNHAEAMRNLQVLLQQRKAQPRQK